MIRYMKKLGANGELTIEDFRTWPVFLKLRKNKAFAETFKEIFGVELIAPVSEDTKVLDNNVELTDDKERLLDEEPNSPRY